MGARDAKKRHFRVEALEERLALDATITTATAFSSMANIHNSGSSISSSSTGGGNSGGTVTVSGNSSSDVTVVSDPGQGVTPDSVLPAAAGVPRQLSVLPAAVVDEISLDEISPQMGLSL